MSNLVPSNIQVPAHLAARMGKPSTLAQQIMGGLGNGGGESFPRISIKGARFRIVEGGNETVLDSTSLQVVIVGSNPRLSKTWYAKQWDKDAEPQAPDCFSLDGVRPDSQSTNPQNDLCANCPQNAWGSKVTPTGQQIKACADKKRLAVVAAEDPSGPIYLLEVTPAALKGLNAYQRELTMRGIPTEGIITKLSFDTDASFPKLQFGFGGFIDADVQSIVDRLFGSAEVVAVTGQLDGSPGEPVQVTPKQLSVSVAAPPAPVVEPQPEPVEEQPAPVAPKRGFGSAKPAQQAPAPKATPATKPVASVSSLADEIAALVGGADADDA